MFKVPLTSQHNFSKILISLDTCNVTDTASDLENKNRDLEEVVKFQQDTIQDQAMRIEVDDKKRCYTFVSLIDILFSIFVVRPL